MTLVGCSESGKSPPQALGYLATDPCAQNTTEAACDATAPGCRWVDAAISNGTTIDPGGPCENSAGPGPCTSTGACVSDDACLSLGKKGCAANDTCAWSSTKTLCPIGATCSDGGFCHAKGEDGTDCACVSPASASSSGATAVECDCSGGGTGGSGGACTCACPACVGDACPPCDCTCGDGGSTCTDPGTCACNCPACIGPDCAPCACDCGSGGGVTVSSGGTSAASTCAQHTDEASCEADTGCDYIQDPCASNATSCGGSCEPCVQPPPSSPDVPAPVCNCPECPAGSECATCSCGTNTKFTNRCVPPPQPVMPTRPPTPAN